MRAKFLITSVKQHFKDGAESGEVVQEDLQMIPVSSKPYDADGFNEDNTYSKYTPSGGCQLSVRNPALFNQYKQGDTYYADFSKAEA